MLHVHDKTLASDEFKIFIPFRNVLSKFCLLALLYKDVNKLKETIEKKEIEMRKNKREIETKEALLKHMEIQDSLKEDMDYFKNVQIQFFTDKINGIKKQME